MDKKFYTAEKTINGKKYIAQFSGISAAIEAVDNSYIGNTTNISMTKLGNYILKNIIVEPKNLTIDDFDSLEEFNEVIDWGMEVMQGNFRPKAVENKTKKEG